ncbi:hypothetical protein [Flavobacterium agrisoli]|uniref:Uncharacterized protein n=1 Tax=Flavobacterium agrisoli TaxID=2793066 RepID=A0A934PKS9_9FLAO|nr:hypothetical protein [Flavobacterium agrisoli]MBK0369427.1 hypothetical protein [Flavobacterium agrisoli]
MKKSFLTIGLLASVMVLTSSIAPEVTSKNLAVNTTSSIDINGNQSVGQDRKVDINGNQSVGQDRKVDINGNQSVGQDRKVD